MSVENQNPYVCLCAISNLGWAENFYLLELR